MRKIINLLQKFSLLIFIAVSGLSSFVSINSFNLQANAQIIPSFTGTLFAVQLNFSNSADELVSIDQNDGTLTTIGSNTGIALTQGLSSLDAAGHRYFFVGTLNGTRYVFVQDTQSGVIINQLPLPNNAFQSIQYETINVSNEVPNVDSLTVSPNPVPVNTSVTATANFSDVNTADVHTATANWGDNTSATACTVSESNGSGTATCPRPSGYTNADIYSPYITVIDNQGASGDSPSYHYLSVYNPTPQGLFSGARIFNSPVGAYPEQPGVSGQVKFGVTSKYQNGTLTGDVSMKFNAANFEFNSTGITVLVTASGKATLRGEGTIVGRSGTYNFLVTGIDGANDTIRFQITNPANNNAVIYDSQIGAEDTSDPITPVTGQVIVH